MTAPGSRLLRYDAMLTAIAECERVDEAKDIRDKAIALEAYYRQARNMEAERKAANVRLRAERRTGQLLKELARADHAQRGAQGGYAKAGTSHDGTCQPSPYARTLAGTGMSRQQAHRFQALANVPAEDFEAALAAAEKPTTSGVARRASLKSNAQPQVSDDALWLWGRLRDFERSGFLTTPPPLDSLTDAMRADVLRLAPRVAEYLDSLEERE